RSRDRVGGGLRCVIDQFSRTSEVPVLIEVDPYAEMVAESSAAVSRWQCNSVFSPDRKVGGHVGEIGVTTVVPGIVVDRSDRDIGDMLIAGIIRDRRAIGVIDTGAAASDVELDARRPGGYRIGAVALALQFVSSAGLEARDLVLCASNRVDG